MSGRWTIPLLAASVTLLTGAAYLLTAIGPTDHPKDDLLRLGLWSCLGSGAASLVLSVRRALADPPSPSLIQRIEYLAVAAFLAMAATMLWDGRQLQDLGWT